MAFDPFTAIFNLGSQVIDKIWPDPVERDKAKVRLIELQQQGEFKVLEADLQIALAQAATNTAEATRGGFQAGWRPLIGYVGAAALAYNYIVYPLLTWALAIWGPAGVQPPPPVDIAALYPLVTAMLGLGGFRTYEKLKGSAA